MSIPIAKDAQFTEHLFKEMIEHVRANGGDTSDLMGIVGMIATHFVTAFTRDKVRGRDDLIEMIRTNLAAYEILFPEEEGMTQ